MDSIINWVNGLVGGNAYISSALVSIIPLIELKGGIMFARGAGLGFLTGFIFPYIGSTLVFLPIFFLLKPVLKLLKKIKWFNRFAMKVEGYFQNKADDVKNRQGKGKISEALIKQLGVFIFVAIPLPMTGVWTGTAVAVFLGLKFREVILPVICGNLIAGAIISVLAELFLPYVDIILYAMLGLVIVLLVIVIIKIARVKPRAQTPDEDSKDE